MMSTINTPRFSPHPPAPRRALGQMEEPVQAMAVAHAFRANVWDAIQALERRCDQLGATLEALDRRLLANAHEVRLLNARAGEMQGLLGLVLEDLQQSTTLLKGFKDALGEPPPP